MSKSKSSKAIQATSVLYAGAVSMTSFWIFFILVESYHGLSSVFGFYKPVGALLGVFLASLFIFAVTCYGLTSYFANNSSAHKKVQAKAISSYMVSAILFLFMVFPPIIEPIIDWLK